MIIELTHRLDYLNYLLKNKCTGRPKELADKLGISQRCWYKLRDELVNELGVPIVYCSYLQSYYYKEEGTLEIGFRRLSDETKEKIRGGFGGFTEVLHSGCSGVENGKLSISLFKPHRGS